jgi:hypothetical protein
VKLINSPKGASDCALKVLFLAPGLKPDYLCDMVYHGLKSNSIIHLDELSVPWYMYSGNDKKLSRIYGRGFTLYGLLDVRPNLIDFLTAYSRLRSRYYDYIVYGSIKRFDFFYEIIQSHYPKDKIIVIDGEDDQSIDARFTSSSTYYKRELSIEKSPNVRPINFAVPQNRVLPQSSYKSKILATSIPGDSSTYIFRNQNDYFEDYQRSMFGVTRKKGGWDCLRHYEILMNGCIPYFINLDECPTQTLTWFPKSLILETNSIFEQKNFDEKIIGSISNELLDYTRINLTTRRLSEYILNIK